MMHQHRHDLDKKIPRTKKEILALNHKVTTSLREAFRDENNKTIPIVPCIGMTYTAHSMTKQDVLIIVL